MVLNTNLGGKKHSNGGYDNEMMIEGDDGLDQGSNYDESSDAQYNNRGIL